MRKLFVIFCLVSFWQVSFCQNALYDASGNLLYDASGNLIYQPVDSDSLIVRYFMDKQSSVTTDLRSGILYATAGDNLASALATYNWTQPTQLNQPIYTNQNSFTFDGTNTGLNMTSGIVFVNYTVIAEINVTSFANNPRLMSSTQSSSRYISFISDGSGIYFRNTAGTIYTLTYAFSTGVKYIIGITCTYDNVLRLYVNGYQQATVSGVSPSNTMNCIGKRSGTTTNTLSGVISGEFLIYNCPKTATQMLNIYNQIK